MKERIITGLVLIVILLFAIFDFNSMAFDLFVGLIIILGAFEWSRMSDLENMTHRIVYVFLIAFITIISCLSPAVSYTLLYLSIPFWLFGFLNLVYYNKNPNFKLSKEIKLVMGFFILIPTFIGFKLIHEANNYLLLYIILVVSAGDTGAYFVGRSLSSKFPMKLAQKISPKKTVIGLSGGILSGIVFGAISCLFLDVNSTQFFLYTFLSIFIVIFALLGDLFESMIKRQTGIKDSSNILPGHGGILDRIDSLLVVMPLFTILLLTLGLI